MELPSEKEILARFAAYMAEQEKQARPMIDAMVASAEIDLDALLAEMEAESGLDALLASMNAESNLDALLAQMEADPSLAALLATMDE